MNGSGTASGFLNTHSQALLATRKRTRSESHTAADIPWEGLHYVAWSTRETQQT